MLLCVISYSSFCLNILSTGNFYTRMGNTQMQIILISCNPMCVGRTNHPSRWRSMCVEPCFWQSTMEMHVTVFCEHYVLHSFPCALLVRCLPTTSFHYMYMYHYQSILLLRHYHTVVSIYYLLHLMCDTLCPVLHPCGVVQYAYRWTFIFTKTVCVTSLGACETSKNGGFFNFC